MTLHEIYEITKSLFNIGISQERPIKDYIDYFVSKGYDNEEMMTLLGLKRSVKFIYFVFQIYP